MSDSIRYVIEKIVKAGFNPSKAEKLAKSILRGDSIGLTRNIAKEAGGSYHVTGNTGWLVGPDGAETLPDIVYAGIVIPEDDMPVAVESEPPPRVWQVG